MRHRIAGLHDADQSRAGEIPDGLFLVRVERAQHRWHAHKPYYVFHFTVLEPAPPGCTLDSRPPLLLTKSAVEIELVPARLRLRHRTAWAR